MTLSPHELTASLHEEPAQRAWRDWLADHIGLDDEQKQEVYGSIARSATMRDATYWAEIVFAAGIATMGLLLGSPAVIIGAMLISPLMGPIMAAGLALAAGDLVLTIRATANVVISCTVAVAFATLLVALLPFREMTSEIAARTHPNTLDLVVALFSGAAGALATSKCLRGVARSIPGVAIAVALMPPLCVTGYGIGVLLTVDRGQGIAVMGGGALLFVTNLIAIIFSSMLVFLALHVDAARAKARIRAARLLILVTLVGVVFIPLKRSTAERHELNAVQRKVTSPPPEVPLDRQLEATGTRALSVLAATSMPSGASLLDSAITLRDHGIAARSHTWPARLWVPMHSHSSYATCRRA